jgi:asparagine synthetase B (glutamine-hydrolysing)
VLFSGGIDSTLVAHYARQHRPETPGYFVASGARVGFPLCRRIRGDDWLRPLRAQFRSAAEQSKEELY